MPRSEGQSLEGKVAVVTGAAAGIGRAIGLALSEQGAHLAVVDIDAPAAELVAEAARARGVRACAVAADVRDRAAVNVAVATLLRELGGADVLVNNAGAGHEDRRFVELPPESWARVIDVCVYGTLHMTQAVLPAMIARGGGRVVNISSELAVTGSSHAAVYATAKAAVLGFTRSVARDVASASVTVNAVCPGDVETERSAAREAEVTRSLTTEALAARRHARASRIPLGRPGTIADVVAAVLYLCSPAASYITGQTLLVNGGSTML